MEVKIKTKDFLVDAIIEMVDGVMLVSPVADVDLKPKKWLPEEGKVFYFPRWDLSDCRFSCVQGRCVSKNYLDGIREGWVLQTKEECNRFCDKLNEKIEEAES